MTGTIVSLVTPLAAMIGQIGGGDVPQRIDALVSSVSLDIMIAQGRDACRPTRQEADTFRRQNERRWDSIETALQNRFGDKIAFGVVIPEACRHARDIAWPERRATYQRDLVALERALAIADEE